MKAKALTFDQLVQEASQNEELREALHDIWLVQLRNAEQIQAQFYASTENSMKACDIIPSDLGSDSTRDCLKGAAHLLSLAAVSLNDSIERLRQELDQLGTPE